MNRNMAPRALAAGLKSESTMRRLAKIVESGMTLKAKLAAFAPDQQHTIRGTVRIVARNTALYLRGRMLVHIGPSLFDVALNAGFRLRLHKTRRIQRSVRVVAIRTLHQSFRNTVMHRLRKLPANRCVARIAEVRLRGFQQAARKPARFIRELRYLEKVWLRRRGVPFTRVFDGINKVT